MNELWVGCLIGIPASGKTSLSIDILTGHDEINADVILLSFDDFITLDYSDTTVLANGDYKKSRESLLNKIKFLLENIKQVPLHELKSFLLTSVTSSGLSISANNFRLTGQEKLLILLDDNNYLKSMRKNIRNICNDLEVAYFQMFLEVDIETAKLRNNSRSNSVPVEIIEKLHAKLEPPSKESCIYIHQHLPKPEIFKMINEKLSQPLKVFPKPTTPIAIQPSIVHAIDLIIRKEINSKIKEMKKQDKDIQECFLQFNNKRKQFLDDLRSNHLGTTNIDELTIKFHSFLDNE
ncbi:unnamed protein product [Diamesa hyperborea]